MSCNTIGSDCDVVASYYYDIDSSKYTYYMDKTCEYEYIHYNNPYSCNFIGKSVILGYMGKIPVKKDFRVAANYFQKAHNLRGLALSYYLLGDVQTATDYAQKYCEASDFIRREVAWKSWLGLLVYEVSPYLHHCTLNSQLYYTIALAYDHDLNDKHEAGKFMRYACLEKSPEACNRLSFYAENHTSDGDYGVYESEGRQFAEKACNYAKSLYDYNHCSNITGPKYRELYCGYNRDAVIVGLCQRERLYHLEELQKLNELYRSR